MMRIKFPGQKNNPMNVNFPSNFSWCKHRRDLLETRMKVWKIDREFHKVV